MRFVIAAAVIAAPIFAQSSGSYGVEDLLHLAQQGRAATSESATFVNQEAEDACELSCDSVAAGDACARVHITGCTPCKHTEGSAAFTRDRRVRAGDAFGDGWAQAPCPEDDD